MCGNSYGICSNLRDTLQLEQERPHQQQKRDEARNRVAWQAHEMSLARLSINTSVSKGLARLDGDLPQVEMPQRFHRGFDVVFFPH